MNIHKIPFTKTGYNNLLVEQTKLVSIRKEAVEQLKKAREMGDLSENGFYKAAKAKLGSTDSRIRHLTYLIKHALIIESKMSDVVQIGSKVVIKQGNLQREFEIVGGYESNPLNRKISHTSPLGIALMGRHSGEEIIVTAPVGKITYKIISIK